MENMGMEPKNVCFFENRRIRFVYFLKKIKIKENKIVSDHFYLKKGIGVKEWSLFKPEAISWSVWTLLQFLG
jgi:hypothetical protein